jgi:hypothetical protein
MEKDQIIGISLIAGIVLLAILLARVISQRMFSGWRKFASTFPVNPTKPTRTINFTSITLIGGFLPLRLNNFVQLSSTEDVFQIKVPLMGLPLIQIPRSAIRSCNDNSIGPFTKTEIDFVDSEFSLVFRGRGARFAYNWWKGKTV